MLVLPSSSRELPSMWDANSEPKIDGCVRPKAAGNMKPFEQTVHGAVIVHSGSTIDAQRLAFNGSLIFGRCTLDCQM